MPLTRDSMFKKIMTSHPEFLKLLLHHILKLPLTDLGEIYYRDKEILPKYLGKKIYYLDLFVDVMITDTQTGRIKSRPICVEMHSTSPPFVLNKVSAYGHRLYDNQLEEGDDYSYHQLKNVYCIGIFKQKVPRFICSDYMQHLSIANLAEPVDRMPGTRYWLVELAKFNKKFGELRTERDKILYFIKNADIIMRDPEQALYYIRLGGIMAKVINYAMDYSSSKEYQQILDYIDKERADRATHMVNIKAAGRAEGIVEERERGAVKLKKVAAESKLEAKIDIAKELLAKDWDLATVAEVTKLDISIIRELKYAAS